MKFSRIVFCLFLAFAFSGHALADLIDYGDINGETVVFSGIMETSSTTQGAVYGAPMGGEQGMGDTISFVPFGFQGLSTGEIDFEEGRLSFHVVANEGYQIESIEVVEASSFFLFGIDSMVMSSSFGVANTGGSLFTGSTLTEMTIGDFSNQNSFGSGFVIELPNVQQMTFTLDSQVFAAAFGGGSLASISKDALVLRINTRPVSVPEPTSMGFITIIGVVCYLRRRMHP